MTGNRTTGPLAGGLAALLLAATAPPALAGKTERVSVGSAEQQANGDSYNAAVSAGGRYVAFTGRATTSWPATNGAHDVFVRDRKTGTTDPGQRRPGRGPGERRAATTALISRDGRYVAFTSRATNLVRERQRP